MHSTESTSPKVSRFFLVPALRILTGILAVLVPVAVAQLAITALPVERLVRNILLGVITPAVAVWAYLTFVRLAERRSVKELDPRSALRELGAGLLLGFGMFVLTVGGIAMFGAYSVAGTNGWAVLVTPLMIGLASGFFEEILFRGVLFRMIEESLGSWAALGISALIFGGLHLLNENATLQGAMAVMLEAGIMLAGAYMFTRRLWLPIGIHIAWNFTQAGIFGIAVSGNEPMPGLLKSVLSGPTWLTGGEFGAEASVIAVLLGAVLGAFFIWSSFRKGGAVAMVRKQTSG